MRTTDFVRDLRLAARGLASRPGFAVVAVLTLALGIGANSAIFTLLHGVLLAPLPYPEPDRLARIWTQFPEDGQFRFPASAAEYLDYRDETRLFDRVAGWSCGDLVLSGEDTPQRLGACGATADLWPMLGLTAAAGRLFGPEDDRPGAEPVVLLSHSLWQRRYDGSPAVLGRRLRLDGDPTTVVGVLPEDFALRPDAELWVPLALDRQAIRERSGHFLSVAGRLSPGATLEQVREEMAAVTGRWERQYDHAHPMTAEPFAEAVVGSARTPLWMLAGAVGLVLLVACANVAGLLLARGEARRREMAVRAALGASPGRLVSQVLAESVLLAGAGGALGLLLAVWGVDGLLAVVGGSLPRSGEIAVGAPVLAFTLGISLLTALVFGLLPGLRAARTGPAGELRSGDRAGSRSRLRGALVVAEVAVAVVLVAGSGLLVRSLWNLLQVDPGFDTEGVVAVRLDLPGSRYPERDDIAPFFPRLVDRLRALPGVASVSTTTSLPLAEGLRPEGFRRLGGPGDRAGDREEPSPMGYVGVAPGYFHTLGIPLRGRDFTAADRAGAPRVAIVDEALARTYFPGEDPVGQRIQVLASRPDDVPFELVGVAGAVRHEALGVAPEPTVYVPHAQMVEHGFRPPRSAVVTVRTEGNPTDLGAVLRREVARMDPELALSELGSLDALRRTSVARPRLLAVLLGAFSVLALVLAAVGLYGLMAQLVGQRRREMGVRMALGADRGAVVRRVVGQGLRLTLAGLALGLAGSLGAGGLLRSLLYEVGTADPASFAATAVLLLLVALAACWLPALRAARVDPAAVLRAE